jgi:peptidoglycan-associated lipoprotein
MMMRRLPALCAGVLMLAACTGGDANTRSPAGTPTGSVKVDSDPFEDKFGPEYFRAELSEVRFNTDAYALSAEAQGKLQKQTAWLAQYPQYALTIDGHADERGTREYNLALGERRAQAIMDYLIALGVDPKRLKTISYGKERPICTEANEACWSQNRRGVSTLDN